MWKRTTFLLLILPLISSPSFLSSFQISKTFISLFSGTEWHTKLKLGTHMDSRLMYHVYLNQAGVYLFLYFFIFLLTNSKTLIFVTLFCEFYKVVTWYTHGQRVDLLCAPNTSSQNILFLYFSSFFLSLQLAKIKTCFYKIVSTYMYLWWLRPEVCELCSLPAIFVLVPVSVWYRTRSLYWNGDVIS